MFLRILDRLEEIIITFTLMAAATILITFLAVAAPLSGTGVPAAVSLPDSASIISWAQELCIYMFIWMAKFGAAYGVRTGIHVGVDVLLQCGLTIKWRKRVSCCSGCLAARCSPSSSATMGAKFVIRADEPPTRSRRISSCPAGSSIPAFRSAPI